MYSLTARRDPGFGQCSRSSSILSLVAIAIMQYSIATSFAAAQTMRGGHYKETVLHRFTGLNRDGANPLANPLALDVLGNVFGTTANGGAYDRGSIFERASSGKLQVLHSFSGTKSDGQQPLGQLAMDANGAIYGTTWIGGQYQYGTIFKVAANDGIGRDRAVKFTTLYSFTNSTDGGDPSSGVILDSAGNLYGVTWNGGANGDGTLFQFTPGGQLNVLYNFGSNSSDGGFALGLAMDAQGNIYGTDLLGGPYENSNCLQTSWVPDFGCGVVFKIDSSGQETLLHVFSGVDGDGGSPAGPPILDSAGNLYGTTLVGGAGSCQGSSFPTGGCGTVFEIDAEGNYTVLYSFPGTGSDGAGPVGSLVMDSERNFYGATEDGGSGSCAASGAAGGGYYTGYPGCGVAFKLDAKGTERVLHRFSGLKDGGNPESGLVAVSAPIVYGTTYSGGDITGCGSGYGCGTVFKLQK